MLRAPGRATSGSRHSHVTIRRAGVGPGGGYRHGQLAGLAPPAPRADGRDPDDRAPSGERPGVDAGGAVPGSRA